MLLQKHLQIAIAAHRGTSFSPERRGEQYVKDYSEQLADDLQKVAEKGGDAAEYQAKYERLFLSWMHAKGNCLSSMITGPSGFPVRRAEKANRSERNRYEEFTQFRERYFARLEKNLRREARAASDPLAEMRAKLESAEKMQALMVAANKVIRKKVKDAEKVALLMESGISERLATELLAPDWSGRIGFATYQLTNNLANIKRMQARVKELEAKKVATTTETARADGIVITENAQADRLQIFFPGKPAPEMITALKKSAFKWSPSNGCWQRQLTDNARHAARKILS
jgi:hypothetical protein